MNNKLLFTRRCSPQKKLQCFIKKYRLNLLYRDKHEAIFENSYIMLSVTKYVLYILIYDNENINLSNEIKTFFYGDENE